MTLFILSQAEAARCSYSSKCAHIQPHYVLRVYRICRRELILRSPFGRETCSKLGKSEMHVSIMGQTRFSCCVSTFKGSSTERNFERRASCDHIRWPELDEVVPASKRGAAAVAAAKRGCNALDQRRKTHTIKANHLKWVEMLLYFHRDGCDDEPDCT